MTHGIQAQTEGTNVAKGASLLIETTEDEWVEIGHFYRHNAGVKYAKSLRNGFTDPFDKPCLKLIDLDNNNLIRGWGCGKEHN
jgi:hypothetical protein